MDLLLIYVEINLLIQMWWNIRTLSSQTIVFCCTKKCTGVVSKGRGRGAVLNLYFLNIIFALHTDAFTLRTYILFRVLNDSCKMLCTWLVLCCWLMTLPIKKTNTMERKRKQKKNIFLKYFIVDFNVLEIILPKQKYILHIYNNVWFYLQNGDLGVK